MEIKSAKETAKENAKQTLHLNAYEQKRLAKQ